MAQKLRITLVRGVIGRPKKQRAIVKALGLHRIRHTVEHSDTPQIRGMVRKVEHLVSCEEA